jgi:hypothetical protein
MTDADADADPELDLVPNSRRIPSGLWRTCG